MVTPILRRDVDATEVKTYELQLREYVVASLIDVGFADPDVRTFMQYKLESMAHMMVATFRVPTKVLQDRRVIAEWPDGLWQHIKQKLGLRYRHKQIRLNEALVFPDVYVPRNARNTLRMVVQDEVTFDTYRDDK